MEEQNTTPVAPAEPAPVKSDEPIILGGEKKSSKGMIAGLIILAVVAVAGIAFGVFELMQVSEKDSQIAHLNQQVTNCANANNNGTSEKIEVTCPDGTEVEVDNYVLKNPVIDRSDLSIRYSTDVISFGPEKKTATLNIVVNNGKVNHCSYSGNNGDCSVAGLDGSIYKIVDIYEGNGPGSEKIGFLMEDGSVWYSYLYNRVENTVEWKEEFAVKKVNIDGFVKDIVPVGVYDGNVNGYGYASTIFVLNDNSIVKYDESMF